ncbi:hypothetical protein GGR76_001984 [Xanthomonas translucens]|nr:hypothetical protein [Xanthomonas campestris]
MMEAAGMAPNRDTCNQPFQNAAAHRRNAALQCQTPYDQRLT